ncbi:MAG: 50S ribosomal protein L17 [Candidatus Omnitrophota bacterium]|mgnify:CR=1 FL=1|nr:MAG: 50S ribosomal protein L17 [Candidatus Omnitrophota bacterium]
MRHNIKRLQLNRFTSWRKATLKSLAQSLLYRQSIKTTKTKAFAVKPLVDNLITLGKKNTLNAKRKAFQILGDHKLVSILFNDIARRFESRASGFTRILNLGRRRGDNAQVVILELTEIKKKEISPAKAKAKAEEAAPEKQAEIKPEKGKPVEPKKAKKETGVAQKEKPPVKGKPKKKFFGGISKIFKKRDAK